MYHIIRCSSIDEILYPWLIFLLPPTFALQRSSPIVGYTGRYLSRPTLLASPKERMNIYFEAVRVINLYSRGRPPQPARWGKILSDLPNVESISRGDNTLYRSTESGTANYECEYKDTIVLGEPHPRLRYPNFHTQGVDSSTDPPC
ncbi:uncharacterized protein L199_002013 [Kwoniella botswanensis]|uniref:uncharacterized protein n=1 Tax=Kwoniella botswanensis TaxID=1268659 RepID=UPI00315D7D79